jgi:hypothetical protein
MLLLLKFNNPVLKKIVNVYQPKYINLCAQGFGDYLRGCFCLYQICQLYGLEFDMDISNHPMFPFLDNSNKENYSSMDRNKIAWFTNPNYIPIHSTSYTHNHVQFHNEFITLLNKIQEPTYFLFCNSFPIFKTYSNNLRLCVLQKINPNFVIKEEVENCLKQLGLEKKTFGIIHIRTGDNHLLNNYTLKLNYVQKIIKILKPFLILKKKYLILSDNNEIKYFFKKYHNCVFHLKSPTHLGENGDKTDEKIKNTLIDFYIMQHANFIISLSPYAWGSGFSQWCSLLYKVPYKNYRII